MAKASRCSARPVGLRPAVGAKISHYSTSGYKVTAAQTSSDLLPISYLHSTALHEAGHAVLSVVLGRKLLRVSIERDAGGNGIAEHVPDLSTRQAVAEETAIMLVGGEAASLWGFITNIDGDEARALCAVRRELLAPNPEEYRERIRACVSDSVLALKAPIGLFALELFRQRAIEGPLATLLIQDAMGGPTCLNDCLASLSL